ncbi:MULTISPECIES: substrate-binding periplasmic protein [Massilia]|uniref:Transporter substrate-binding domain-containing protein n=2 Tax=Massilia TaxID=149698 RepID=A0ABX0MV01_9BURK|nr:MULTISPECIES: transporter substrate-binding domain-containing protein [Massilia]NHZ66586.1 transporter substrate-binding domain-containing protein [Massilia genomosp. 1]NHZ93031.1 transporter substrate-binding domain-containing protein [Massilia mucilaginosa]
MGLTTMIRSVKSGIWLLCGCLGFPGSAFAAPQLSLYTLEWPPFSSHDTKRGKVIGISSNIVTELFRRSGMAVPKQSLVPWARGLAITASSKNTCLMPVARVPEREARYRWIGPIGSSEWALFARTEDRIILNEIDDARRYRIGTLNGDLSVSYLIAHQIQPAVVSDDKQNIRKMQMGRIDLWSTGRIAGQELINQLGVKNIEPVLTFMNVQLYLACSLDMGDIEVERLNSLLKAMLSDGTIKQIYRQHGFGEYAPASTSSLK